MEKVLLSKEIADALNSVKEYYSPAEIIATIVNDRGCTAYGTEMHILVKRYHEGTLDINKLMNALVNGFDIEKTEENKLKEKYNAHKKNVEFYKDKIIDYYEAAQDGFSRGFIIGVEQTVKTFQINFSLDKE